MLDVWALRIQEALPVVYLPVSIHSCPDDHTNVGQSTELIMDCILA